MAQVLFNPDSTPAGADLDANFTELYSKTAWSTTGIGYATGAGGTVTQATSKSTAVTLNKNCGQITTHNAALASGASVTFTLNNSMLVAGDTLAVHVYGAFAGAGNYEVRPSGGAGGSIQLILKNVSGGSLSEAVTISFAVIKVVTT